MKLPCGFSRRTRPCDLARPWRRDFPNVPTIEALEELLAHGEGHGPPGLAHRVTLRALRLPRRRRHHSVPPDCRLSAIFRRAPRLSRRSSERVPRWQQGVSHPVASSLGLVRGGRCDIDRSRPDAAALRARCVELAFGRRDNARACAQEYQQPYQMLQLEKSWKTKRQILLAFRRGKYATRSPTQCGTRGYTGSANRLDR